MKLNLLVGTRTVGTVEQNIHAIHSACSPM